MARVQQHRPVTDVWAAPGAYAALHCAIYVADTVTHNVPRAQGVRLLRHVAVAAGRRRRRLAAAAGRRRRRRGAARPNGDGATTAMRTGAAMMKRRRSQAVSLTMRMTRTGARRLSRLGLGGVG